MAFPFGLRVLSLLFIMAGLLESHAWARSVDEERRPSYMECPPRYPPGWKGLILCPDPTPEELECMKGRRERIDLEWKAAESKADQARNLTVNIEQVNKDPIIIIHIQVTNNSTMPVTFLNVSTPLDPDAFGLGLFHITPDNLPMVNFGNRVLPQRCIPPNNETYVEIGPGMTLYNTVTILGEDSVDKEGWARMLDMADRVVVRMKGKWHGIWATTRDKAIREAESESWYKRDFGGFESNVIELEI